MRCYGRVRTSDEAQGNAKAERCKKMRGADKQRQSEEKHLFETQRKGLAGNRIAKASP